MSGPAPRVLTEDELTKILSEQQLGVLAAVRRTGHPHLSTVVYHWDPERRILRVPTTADRLKPRLFARDPHAALHVSTGPYAFAVAEGTAEVTPPSTEPGDATGRELLAMTEGFDDPADEAAYLREMVRERRVVVRIRVERLYGTALDV
ncbi:pyridoxamine 5'-phosphate oxidase family protein [Actinomycetota bacterium Odt1-20B]